MASRPPNRKRRRWLIAVIVIVVLLAASWRIARMRQRVTLANCARNMVQISMALQQYHDDYGCYPPAHVLDANGNPMHSWRVLILPQLGYNELYSQYDFDEPWNSANNERLLARIPAVFRCPASKSESRETSYVAVAGPGTAWPGAKSSRKADFSDDPATSIMLVEVADSGIAWLEPHDFSGDELVNNWGTKARRRISSSHLDCHPLIIWGDGSLGVARPEWSRELLKSLFTIAGNEVIDTREVLKE